MWTGRGQLEKQGADGISIFAAVEKQLNCSRFLFLRYQVGDSERIEGL
jgi:hypothetical protein